MMNYIWSAMIILAYVFGITSGKTEAVTQSMFDGVKGAVEMVISLLGMMCFWSGLLEIATRSGLTEKLVRLSTPLIRILFPRLKKEKEAKNAIVMNIIANFLGLSNAATPFGIKAMEELDKINGKKGTASAEMCIFAVINTASLTLIPTTLITLRSAMGSSQPFSVIVPVWICSVVSITLGVTAAKYFERREAKKGICRR